MERGPSSGSVPFSMSVENEKRGTTGRFLIAGIDPKEAAWTEEQDRLGSSWRQT